MSIYSSVTPQDLDNLRKLAQQQKNHRAEKIKNRIIEKTHDIKLTESLPPITERLDLVENNDGVKISDKIKKSATENTPTPQPEIPQAAIENTQPQLSIENNQDDTQPGILYEVSLENTLTNMQKKEKGFFKRTEGENRQRFWNGIPVKISGDSKVELKGKNFNITPNLQDVFTDTTGKSLKKLDKTETQTYKQLLKTLNYKNYKHKSGEKNSGRYKKYE